MENGAEPSRAANRHLSLRNMFLLDHEVRGLFALSNLRHLDLSYTEVSDDGMEAIVAALPSLTSLNVVSRRVTTEGRRALAAQNPALTLLPPLRHP